MLHKRSWLILPLVGLLAGLAAFGACGDDDDGGSEEDRAAIEALVQELASYSGDDVEAFLDRVTDNFLFELGSGSRDDCRANVDECVGEPSESATIANLEIDGDTASGELTIVDQDGEFVFGFDAIKEAGAWKADGFSVLSDEIPEGVGTVDLELVEFAFAFESDSDLVKGGDFAFHVTNGGEQIHEVGLVKIPEDADVDELLQSEEQSQEVEDITVKFPFTPGDEADMAVPTLDPGRYLLVCFVPHTTDEEGTPHAFKGMRAEFTVE